jgi:hypothetical protein
VAAAALACGLPPSEPDRLPDTAGEWTAAAETSEFAGDDLFIYINGGAEIYHEHGFDRLAVREYGRGDERVAVELYTMAGTAYGIYSYARSGSGQSIDLGAGGTLADYYLHFWSGPHLVAVTARDGPGDVQAAVLDLGTLLAADFQDSGEPPQLMDLLPIDRCEPGSERYVAGPIGLNNAAPRVAALFRGFEEAAVSRCRSETDEEARLVVLRWGDPAAATRAVNEARERAASTNGIDGGPVGETGFSFRFDEDETMVGGRTGPLVRLAVARGGDEPRLDRLFPIDNWEAIHEQEDRTQ